MKCIVHNIYYENYPIYTVKVILHIYYKTYTTKHVYYNTLGDLYTMRLILCNVPRYNTTSAESEPEWRTIYWSKAQSYIIQHYMRASPKEGTKSFTDLSIITPKDNWRKQLSFCCLIRLLLLWIYVNIARNL